MRALVVVVLGLCLLTACDKGESDMAPVPRPAAVPDGWRTESYGDVTLQVPEAWAQGYSPMAEPFEGSGELLLCGSVEGPYVGRPQMGSDVCRGDPDAIRSLPFDEDTVWFESPLPLGKRSRGVPAETIKVGTTRVTVAAKDAEVRARILASARPLDDIDPNGCPQAPIAPDPERSADGPGTVRSFAVCVYDEEGGLLWSGTRPPSSGDAMLTAVRTAKPAGTEPKRKAYQVVNLVMTAEDPDGGPIRTLHWRIEPDLTRLIWNGQSVELTADLIRPWAGDGIKAYVVGGGTGEVYGFFRGILG